MNKSISKRTFSFIPVIALVAVVGIAVSAHEDADPIVAPAAVSRPFVLRADDFQRYVDSFNQNDYELYTGYIPNAAVWRFLQANIPLLNCPDKEIEEIYYFRWWTYRKHIKLTPDGFIIDEFLPNVGWAGKYNSIDCAAGHHFREGRWLADPRYLEDYARFWFRNGGGNPRLYGFWAADSIWAFAKVTGDFRLAEELLPDLIKNYEAWEKGHREPNGLYWQVDDRDGMEMSIGGSGYRATINSYMYGDALAIAHIAERDGQPELAAQFRDKAARLKQLVLSNLWDSKAQFFKVSPRPDTLVPKSAGILEWEVNNDVTLARAANVSASYCCPSDTLQALNDGLEPKSSSDTSVPRMTFWDHQGTAEWVQYDFPTAIEARSVQVYWFQDTSGCRVPKSWQLLYRDGDEWRPVKSLESYRVAADRYNQLAFELVKTTGLRIELVCQDVANEVPGQLHLVDVRELHGFTPWYFNLPDPPQASAWKQLIDPKGFFAPFGPTTAEQRSPEFRISYQGHECQWNGPSWPYATAITLTAMANLLNNYQQNVVTPKDYFDLLKIYTKSQHITVGPWYQGHAPNGAVIPWIDEDLNPYTGDWIAHTLLLQSHQEPFLRGKDYNHSTYCDLIISGLVGLRSRADDTVEVHPLVPETWDYFCLDQVRYHGRWLTILWDKSGAHYHKGKGLRVFADGKEIAAAETLTRVTAPLPTAPAS